MLAFATGYKSVKVENATQLGQPNCFETEKGTNEINRSSPFYCMLELM